MGGLMALYAGLRAPHIFGHIASQSGAFRLHPERPFVVYDLARHLPPPDLRLWLDCGLYERLIDGNREMAALLSERGSSFTYHEYSGGHNYTCWSMVLPRALETIYGA
jgi:enterochelin esterase family protein